jgi:NAD-dependent dihydropyrimidine dehydrogenase PreA subunit
MDKMAVEIYKIELCNGCGTCVDTCPCDVFRMDKVKRKTVIVYPEDCQVCSMCTVYCPTGAIIVTPNKNMKPMMAYM